MSKHIKKIVPEKTIIILCIGVKNPHPQKVEINNTKK